jgi:small conductance mechanosensitive channel
MNSGEKNSKDILPPVLGDKKIPTTPPKKPKKEPLTKEQLRLRKQAIRKWVGIVFQGLIIAGSVFVAIFSDLLFDGSEFGEIINRTLGKFFDIGSLISNNYLRILESLTVLLFVWIIRRLYDAFVAIFVPKKAQVGTTMLLIKNAVSFITAFIGLLFILTAWGVETVTLLASIGLIGLVISFGAQSIVEDIFSGLFLIIEKQFSVGDIVTLDGFRGRVTEIGLRTTKFLDIENNDLKIVNNKDVRNVINMTFQHSTSQMEVTIAYEEDLERVEGLIESDFIPLFKKKYSQMISAGPEYMGVENLAASSVNLMFETRCDETDRLQVNRMINREFKLFCDRHKIDIPFPQVSINQKNPPSQK